MATPSKEQKASLLKAGTWAEFTLHVEELKRTMTPAAALRNALERYLPAGSPVVAAAGRSYEPPGAPVSETKPTEGALRKQGTRKPAGRAPAPPASVKGGGVELISISAFSDSESSVAENLRWLYDNMCVEEACPGNCPSSGAWAHLVELRSNPTLRHAFYNQTYTKMLPKTSEDEGNAKVMDGQPIVDHIERIRGIGLRLLRGSSEVERRTHNPDVVGSSPAPATNEERRGVA